MTPARPDGTASALRRDFDASFAAAVASERPRLEDFLGVRVGGDAYALALTDVAGLHRDWRIVAVPSDAPELLGIAGSRGAIVPVYDLGALLGYPPERAARWVVAVRASLVALAFPAFDGHVQVAPQAVSEPEGASGLLRGTVLLAGAPRPIIHAAAVVDLVARRGPARAPGKEP